MKNKIIIAAAIAALSGFSWAGEIKEEIGVDKNGHVYIKSPIDSVKVLGWDASKISINGDVDGEYTLKSTKEGVFFEVLPKKGAQGSKADVVVYVPSKSLVSATSTSANISLENISGKTKAKSVDGAVKGKTLANNIHLHSLNGDVTLEDSSGVISVEAVNGSVVLSGSKGAATLKNGSGKVAIDSELKELNASNVSGDLKATLRQVHDLTLNTVNGNVYLETALVENAKLKIESVNGNVMLKLPENVSASFKINTHKGGAIENTLTSDNDISQAKNGARELSFSSNKGSAEVSISSLSGNISLAKASPSSSVAVIPTQEFNWDDVEKSVFDFSYRKPGSKFSEYTSVYIKEPVIKFDKKWLRDYGSSEFDEYRERVTTVYSRLLKRSIEKYIAEHKGIEVTDKRVAGGLVVIPKIERLSIMSPDVGELKNTILTVAGHATLDFTLYSSKEKAVMAMIVDHKRTKPFASAEATMPTRVANERAFRKLFERWSKGAVKFLAESK